jgi:hypothetical protein
MTLPEIKQAVLSGKTVHWCNPSYRVVRDKLDQWFIQFCSDGNMIGLTQRDDKTMNGDEKEFFIKE